MVGSVAYFRPVSLNNIFLSLPYQQCFSQKGLCGWAGWGFFFFKKEKILMSVMNYSHLHLHIPINNRFCSVHSIAFTKSFLHSILSPVWFFAYCTINLNLSSKYKSFCFIVQNKTLSQQSKMSCTVHASRQNKAFNNSFCHLNCASMKDALNDYFKALFICFKWLKEGDASDRPCFCLLGASRSLQSGAPSDQDPDCERYESKRDQEKLLKRQTSVTE